MMRERRKQWRTCSGVALVATSKSFGVRPASSRRQAGQQIAHGATDDVRLVAIFLQGFDGAPAATTDVLTLQPMLGGGEDGRFAVLAGVMASEDAGDELADH